MNEMEILKERKMCSMCTDCSDEICFKCKRVNGSTLKEIETAFDSAIQALQAQVERDKMLCENCSLKDNELCRAVWKMKYNIRTGKWTYKTMMEDDGFCSRFEPKEETSTSP